MKDKEFLEQSENHLIEMEKYLNSEDILSLDFIHSEDPNYKGNSLFEHKTDKYFILYLNEEQHTVSIGNGTYPFWVNWKISNIKCNSKNELTKILKSVC